MNKLILSLATALSLTASLAGPVVADSTQHDRAFDRSSKWDKLGQRRIDGDRDRDRIEVRRNERYSTIRLVVENSGIALRDLVITFDNGQKYSPGTRLFFTGNSTSRDIALPGGLRKIQRIEFVSGNLDSGAHAMVEVWGLGAGNT